MEKGRVAGKVVVYDFTKWLDIAKGKPKYQVTITT